MSKINQPYDFLEDSKFLKTILEDNHALNHGDYRPLEEFNKVMRDFGRDMLRNYLKDSYQGRCSNDEIEKLIADFELEFYGTQNKGNDKG